MMKWSLLFALTLSFTAHAGMFDKNNEEMPTVISCNGILSDKLRLVPSGREDEGEQKKLENAINQLMADGGVYDRLGISRPYQVIHMLPGGELNQVGNVNGMPIAHWKDGQAISRTNQSSILYELVISGKDEHFSFYRDDNPFMEQFSILLHATAGHNHFSENSRYPHHRSVNRVQESYDLSRYLDKMRVIHGGDEVSRWYQYLLSMNYAQDLTQAIYQTPEDLVDHAPNIDPKTKKPKSGLAPTANILQAFVANPPTGMADWKVEVARRFERLQRFIPGAVQTKIINEGWATLMMFVLPKHTEYNDFDEAAIPYCCLIGGVIRPNINNPYWLGLEAWKNIYKRFLDRPEIKKMQTWAEKDGAFIRWATKEVIATMNDGEFLKFGLDADWVAKNNLALTRPWTDQEYQQAQDRPQPPNPMDPKKNWPYSIVSRNADEVIDAIVTQVKGLQFSFPRIVLDSLNDKDNGQVTLEINDLIGREVALDRLSVVQTLYVLSQLREKPVSLESTFETAEVEWPPHMIEGGWLQRYRDMGYSDEMIAQMWRVPYTHKIQRVKVTVNPAGKVQAVVVERDGSALPSSLPAHRMFADPKKPPVEIPNEPLTKTLQTMADAFVEELNLGERADDEDNKFESAKILTALNVSVESAAEAVSPHMQLSMPTVPRALSEYTNILNRRVNTALKEAMVKKGAIIRHAGGVSVKALPNIPWFQFDQKSMQRAMQRGPTYKIPRATQAVQMNSFSTIESVFRPVDLADINSVPGSNGDIIFGPKPKKGQGEGDGDDGEPNRKPSEEGGDEQYADVTLDAYAEALAEEIKLPNLRPKQGMDKNKDDEISGSHKRVSGMAVSSAILRNAFKRGYPMPQLDPNKPAAEPFNPFDGHKIMRRGFSLLRKKEDWVVRKFEDKPAPDINALMVFQMDVSGSMQSYLPIVKQMLFDLRAILMNRYKKVKFLFVTFNDKPYVFEDFDEFAKFVANGGTRYAHSFRKTVDLYEDYPESKWDRFPVVAGDMDESFQQEERDSFEAMKALSQFTTVLRVNDYPAATGFSELAKFFMEQDESDPFVGYYDVMPSKSYTPMIFKRAFKNEQ